MSPFDRLESRLRQLLEGTFAWVAGGGVQPLEIARALDRELSASRLIGISGTFAANWFQVTLNPADWERLEPFAEVVRAELEDYVRRRSAESDSQLAGDVRVELGPAEGVRAGQLRVRSKADARHSCEDASHSPREEPAADTGGRLRIASGPRRGASFAIFSAGAVLGRDPDCQVHLLEPSASRRHAEIVPLADGFLLRDLGSTNGTRVNNQPATERPLVPGDLIAIGSTLLEFQLVHTV
jgi:hypothetical protein